MNKLLIALVLAVVMSGNAYAGVNHLFCSNDKVYGAQAYGYVIESNEQSNSLYYYQSSTDKIAKKNVYTQWSPKYITFGINGFSINREDLTMYMKGNGLGSNLWGQCELIADEGLLKSKVEKFYSQKQNNNKF
jgi:hypothetical protein